ncbi:MAG: hypothetical protein WBA61_04280 [Aequorivita sp.]
MLRNIFNHIADYKTIHPIRFWVFTIGIIVLIALSAYLIKKVFKRYRRRALINQSTSSEIVEVKKEEPPIF